MASLSALAQALKEYRQLKEPVPRAQLEEMAKALPRKNCLADDDEFRNSLTSRQREIFDEGSMHDGRNADNGGRTLQQRVNEVVALEVDVGAQFKVLCNNYKEMMGKIKIYELDVMLEERRTEDLRLDSLELKYTVDDTLKMMAMPTQEP